MGALALLLALATAAPMVGPPTDASQLPIGLTATTALVPGQRQLPLHAIKLPPGFRIQVLARVPSARGMAMDDAGTLYVSTRGRGEVYALPKALGPEPPKPQLLLDGLDLPEGLAFHDGALYVAQHSKIVRFDAIAQHLQAPPNGRFVAALPEPRSNGWRRIAFGPDGLLYVEIAAPCDVCRSTGFAHIERMRPDGSQRGVFATGIRNVGGMAWDPRDHTLWFSDEGADFLGPDRPFDELNRAPAAGLFFGFPFCEGGAPDPTYGVGRDCADFTLPAFRFPPHSTPLGLTFLGNKGFPPGYRNQLYVALSGSWAVRRPVAGGIWLLGTGDGRVRDREVFASGWRDNDGVWGRPSALLAAPDGSLLVSDPLAGAIYRIWYAGR